MFMKELMWCCDEPAVDQQVKSFLYICLFLVQIILFSYDISMTTV